MNQNQTGLYTSVMKLSPTELFEKLPPKRDFWFVEDIAIALGVSCRTIQRTSKRFLIGRKVRHGPKGTYIFRECDLDPLCKYVKGEVGNPVNIAKSRGEYPP